MGRGDEGQRRIGWPRGRRLRLRQPVAIPPRPPSHASDPSSLRSIILYYSTLPLTTSSASHHHHHSTQPASPASASITPRAVYSLPLCPVVPSRYHRTPAAREPPPGPDIVCSHVPSSRSTQFAFIIHHTARVATFPVAQSTPAPPRLFLPTRPVLCYVCCHATLPLGNQAYNASIFKTTASLASRLIRFFSTRPSHRFLICLSHS